MSSPATHSLLSPSNAHRWLKCTAAPRFEEQFPDTGSSVYAEEGTLAHAVCELYGQHTFNGLKKREFNKQLKVLQANELFSPEMLNTAESYKQFLLERFNRYPDRPFITFEASVDLSDWIPDGRGQCDCVIIGGDSLHIVDYKHGQGVAVDARENPQMRLYALGALKLFSLVFGDGIKDVTMSICQPRLSEAVQATVQCEETISVDALRAWGEDVKGKAEIAFNGQGTFCAGSHCRFCKGKERCPERAKQNTALEEFKDLVIPNKALDPLDPQARELLGLPRILTNDEIGDLLRRGETLVAWYNDLKDYAVAAMLDGESISGWKLVEGKSNRAFDDTEAVITDLVAAGYEREQFYKHEPQTLTAMEKIVGKKRFAELVGAHIVKPRGKATLADESDAREAYGSAATDFKDVVSSG